MTQGNNIRLNNAVKLRALKAYALPVSEYAITGSGPLGVRNLREIGDIDIVVTPELWDALAAKFRVTRKNGVEKIVFPEGNIEAFREGSFYSAEPDDEAPSVAERIANAELIDDLPFESLMHILFYKRKMGREKDLRDIAMIESIITSKALAR